ncbi:hypothetical protein HPB50_007466 [Hyalomma asiaticum]|uniref:Uncharacterized protein n=1 Tax=Hyalomma asiaticum TaxID=266040 RepID=A0ACB7TCB9_HYAAI|nr:hypothetical protein HPB50_007466 [Hyalomma asiaticum]
MEPFLYRLELCTGRISEPEPGPGPLTLSKALPSPTAKGCEPARPGPTYENTIPGPARPGFSTVIKVVHFCRQMALVIKMKEESRRHQEAKKQRNQQMAETIKQSCQSENRICSLEAQNRTKDSVLKRRHEEMAALRPEARPKSQGVAGRAPQLNPAVRKGLASPGAGKQRWQALEENSLLTDQSKSEVQELEAIAKQAEASNAMHQNLLQHTVNQMQPEPLAPPGAKAASGRGCIWSEEPGV